MSGPVQFGVAGWSYPDWRGIVYPRGCKDELAWLARYVDLIELNSTFYRVPEPATVAAWVARTREHATRFTAKLPRSVTHERDLAAREDFARALEPLIEAGRLDALLAQFNYRFRADSAAREHLREIAGAFGDLAPLVVELRHASWNRPDLKREVRALGFEIAQLDYPMRDDSFDGEGAAGDRLAYLRIHGRNRTAWYSRDAGRDAVYDYEYDESERGGLLERLRKLVTGTDGGTTFVVANNHFHGKAVKLALELTAAHRGERVDVPDPLLHEYPDLAGIARGVLF